MSSSSLPEEKNPWKRMILTSSIKDNPYMRAETPRPNAQGFPKIAQMAIELGDARRIFEWNDRFYSPNIKRYHASLADLYHFFRQGGELPNVVQHLVIGTHTSFLRSSRNNTFNTMVQQHTYDSMYCDSSWFSVNKWGDIRLEEMLADPESKILVALLFQSTDDAFKIDETMGRDVRFRLEKLNNLIEMESKTVSIKFSNSGIIIDLTNRDGQFYSAAGWVQYE